MRIFVSEPAKLINLPLFLGIYSVYLFKQKKLFGFIFKFMQHMNNFCVKLNIFQFIIHPRRFSKICESL